MVLLQTNIDFAKKIFADRLPYGGTPDNYVYGGTWDPDDPSVGCDCSGLVTDILSACCDGPAMPWDREGLSTESYRYKPLGGPQQIGPFTLSHVARPADFPSSAVVLISLHHEGEGGPDSHMNCAVRDSSGLTYMESNGSVGCCTLGTGAMAMSNAYWNDWWYLDGPILGTTLDYSAPPVPGLVAAQFL